MKKIVYVAIILLALCGMAKAQTYDTVCYRDGKVPYYHLSHWFDTCSAYDAIYLGTPCYQVSFQIHGVKTAVTHSEILQHPISLRGVSVWLVDSVVAPDLNVIPPTRNVLNNDRLPEYAIVLVKDSSDRSKPLFLDSVRWDTAEAKVLKIAPNRDSATYGYRYFWMYNAYFENPITLTEKDTFYLIGTSNSNDGKGFDYNHNPVAYAYLWNRDYHNLCPPGEVLYTTVKFRDNLSINHPFGNNNKIYGGCVPIVDYAQVNVSSADTLMGTAGPDERLSMHLEHLIYANPHIGYRFLRWNDGDTTNPRSVFVSQDTSFVAFFTPDVLHKVVAKSSIEDMGRVTGGGFYYTGETVELEALPMPGNLFHHWDDGNMSNPRSVQISNDTTFTAVFVWNGAHELGIDGRETQNFVISPNPAHGSVNITCERYAGAVLTVLDMAGHERVRRTLTTAVTQLPLTSFSTGVYYVTVVSPSGSCTQKLVVE